LQNIFGLLRIVLRDLRCPVRHACGMAATQAQLDALDEAIALGEMTVEFESDGARRRITYRSISDLMAARIHLQRLLTSQTATTQRTAPRYQVADFSD
jgi:hypothetical protein